MLGIAVGMVAMPAISADSNSEISACVNKKTGDLRISKKCLKSETRLTWGRQGPDGETGPSGIQGPGGPAGQPGAPAINLASNCYQHLTQAESAGYMWTLSADRTRFENLTGCTIREIDLNPNSQIPGFYPAIAPRITSANLVSIHSASGEGSPGDPYYGFSHQGIYEITTQGPENYVLCSGEGPFRRVFENSTTGKTYATAHLYGGQQGHTADITLGWGLEANDVERTWNVDYGLEQFYTLSSGDLTLVFEPIPSQLPLGESAEFRVVGGYYGEEPITNDNWAVYAIGDQLTGVSRLPDETSALASFRIQANEHERGSETVKVRVERITNGEIWDIGAVSFSFYVGTTGCNVTPTNLEDASPFAGFSNLYRIRETDPFPEFSDTYLPSIGWTNWRWFEPEPGFYDEPLE